MIYCSQLRATPSADCNISHIAVGLSSYLIHMLARASHHQTPPKTPPECEHAHHQTPPECEAALVMMYYCALKWLVAAILSRRV